MTAEGQHWLHAGRGRVRELAARRARVLLVTGAVLVVVSSVLPWSVSGVSYSQPLAGDLSTVGIGGHRLYLFVLGLLALYAGTGWPGARRVGMRTGLVVVIISGYNIYGLANEGGGLGAVNVAGWVAVIGGAALLVASDTLPETLPVRWPTVPAVIDIALIIVMVGGALAIVVVGLDINDDKQFVSFSLFIIALVAVAGALGVNAALRRAFDRFRYVGYAAALVAAVAFPFTQQGNAQWMAVFARVEVFAAAAIGLNVVVGLAGLLDLGYIAFFGIGGYVSALLSNAVFTTVHVHVPFLLVIPIGAAIAAAVGVVVGAPTLRLRGDYLAIVTLGFGEIFRIVAINWSGLTQGPNGIAGIPDLKLPPWLGSFDFGKPHTVLGQLLPFQTNYYFFGIFFVAVVMVVFSRLNDSRIGRAWIAIREDELAARAMGVNTVALKLLAFGIGATLAGAAGTINVHIGEAIEPNAYQFIFSALMLSAVVLGGMGTVPGAVLGAALLYGIPEKLRFIQDYRLFLFGLALILLMRFRPEGIIVNRRRQREFHEEEATAEDVSRAEQAVPV